MRHHQLLLFPRPPEKPAPIRCRWLWFPFRDPECARCFEIWPPGASVLEMTTRECPGRALDMGYNIYLC